jgi:outer membrane protein TolC
VQAVEEKLAQITTREEKYEAKLEELEGQLRHDGIRLDPGHPAVKRTAGAGGVDPDGVIRDLKERNPDVPAYAFEDGINDYENDWNGLPDDIANREPGDRTGEYR